MRGACSWPLIVLTLFAWVLCQMPSPGFEKQDIPKITDPDDPHHGQPVTCQNWDDQFKQNCSCQAMADKGDSCKRRDDYGPDTYDEDSNPRCSTHCRRDACACASRCAT